MNDLAILFDLDGTLINTLPDIVGTINLLRQRYGLTPLAEENIRRHIGRGAEHLVAGAFADRSELSVAALTQEYQAIYEENPRMGGDIYPGVRETLEQLRRRPSVKLGIVTNKPSLLADKSLAIYLPGFVFDVVAGPERVSEKKPSARHILDVLPGLARTPAQTWFIGDDPVDAACAEAAGVRFLAAGYGFGGVRTAEPGMLWRFPDLLQKLGTW